MLGLAQSVNRICALTLDDIEDRNGEIFLALGEHPVPLPPRIGVLAERAGPAPSRTTDWLFPGNFPGSHLSGRALSRQLSGLGVTRAGRQAALARLIGTLPAPLVAGSLGYHRNTVAIRARCSARTGPPTPRPNLVRPPTPDPLKPTASGQFRLRIVGYTSNTSQSNMRLHHYNARFSTGCVSVWRVPSDRLTRDYRIG